MAEHCIANADTRVRFPLAAHESVQFEHSIKYAASF